MKSTSVLTLALVLVLGAIPLGSCCSYPNPLQTEIQSAAQRRIENELPARVATETTAVTGARIYTGGAAVSAATTTMHATISLQHSVLSEDQVQMVIVLVTDGDGQPCPDAQVSLSFFVASVNCEIPGNEAVRTDAQGYAQFSVPFAGWERGAEVIVQADARYEQLTATAQNIFILW